MAPARFTKPAAGQRYCCVVGSPIKHSKSPQIHAAFAAQFEHKLIYQRVEVAAGGLAEAVRQFHSAGGRGMNITLPLKEEAYALAQSRSERVMAAQAANTLWFDGEGRISVDNTDGVGLVRDLTRNYRQKLAGQTVLLLGAGGAARGVLTPLLDAGVERLMISNRSEHKAHDLASINGPDPRLSVLGWGQTSRHPPQLIINATSLSLHGDEPDLDSSVFAAQPVCYDMMYGREPTSFMLQAQRHGASKAVDGLGMLVEQAAESYFIWHQQRPETAAVIAELRASQAG